MEVQTKKYLTLRRFKNYQELDEYLQELPEEEKTTYLKIEQIKINCYMKHLDQANNLLQDLLNSINRITDPMDYLHALTAKGWLAYYSGFYKSGYESLSSEAASLYMVTPQTHETDHITIAVDYYIILGRLCQVNGKFEEALKYLKRADSLAKYLEDFDRIQEITGALGNQQFRLGQYVSAYDLFKTAYQLSIQTENRRFQRMWLNSMGMVEIIQGKIDQALETQNNALKLAKEIGDKAGLVNCYINLSDLYLRTGDSMKALKMLTKLKYEDVLNADSYSQILYRTIITYLYLDNMKLAREHLNQLEDMYQEHPEVKVELYYKMAHAIFLKEQTKFRDKAEAEQLFRGIISSSDKPIDFRLNLAAHLYLAEILLSQLQLCHAVNRNTQDEEHDLIAEVQMIAIKLQKLATRYKSHIYDIEAKYILAHIALSDLDLDTARQYFAEAKEIGDVHGILNIQIEDPKIQQKSNENSQIVDNIIHKETMHVNFQKTINSIIHSLPRLSIIMYLLDNQIVPFTELQHALNFSSGNLTRHCDKLITAGYVYKDKKFIGEKITTVFQLTAQGITEFQRYATLIKSYL